MVGLCETASVHHKRVYVANPSDAELLTDVGLEGHLVIGVNRGALRVAADVRLGESKCKWS